MGAGGGNWGRWFPRPPPTCGRPRSGRTGNYNASTAVAARAALRQPDGRNVPKPHSLVLRQKQMSVFPSGLKATRHANFPCWKAARALLVTKSQTLTGPDDRQASTFPSGLNDMA